MSDNEGSGIWADSAYRSRLIESVLEILKFLSHINERAYRNDPLTERQIEANRQRSKIRAKVERKLLSTTRVGIPIKHPENS